MKERIKYFDYIKAICIFFVVITHLSWSTSQRTDLLFPFYIDMAVPIFMIISGYVNTLSTDKHINKLINCYNPIIIIPKFLQILIPYFIVFLFEAIAFTVFGNATYKQVIYNLFTGGWGPGSYYVPVLIQFTFLFPIMLKIIRRLKSKGYALLIAFNIVFEAAFSLLEISGSLYRLCFFRYIVFVCAGILMHDLKGKFNKIILLVSLLIGSGYIILANYLGYEPKIFTNWITTSFPTVFWIFPIVVYGYKYKDKKLPEKIDNIVTTIGQSTYHIFLMQMVWFASFEKMSGPWVMFIPSLIICIVAGVLFSKLDTLLFQKRIKAFFKR